MNALYVLLLLLRCHSLLASGGWLLFLFLRLVIFLVVLTAAIFLLVSVGIVAAAVLRSEVLFLNHHARQTRAMSHTGAEAEGTEAEESTASNLQRYSRCCGTAHL
eukprot:COSAG06_NODE_1157_length_10466_cov_3.303752_3_plen_105_part_00